MVYFTLDFDLQAERTIPTLPYVVLTKTFSLFLQIPYFEDICKGIKAGDTCEKLVGYSAVYRVCFGMACFFFIFCLLTLNINNSKSCRAYIHNGWVFTGIVSPFLELRAAFQGVFYLSHPLTAFLYLKLLTMILEKVEITLFTAQWTTNWIPICDTWCRNEKCSGDKSLFLILRPSPRSFPPCNKRVWQNQRPNIESV